VSSCAASGSALAGTTRRKNLDQKSRSLLRSLVVKRRFVPYAGARAEGALCAVIGGRSEID
jgi:hypothetical protein